MIFIFKINISARDIDVAIIVILKFWKLGYIQWEVYISFGCFSWKIKA